MKKRTYRVKKNGQIDFFVEESKKSVAFLLQEICEEENFRIGENPISVFTHAKKTDFLIEHITYSAVGSVRGDCGHRHHTIQAALQCAEKDGKSCRRLGGGAYSDRNSIVRHYKNGETKIVQPHHKDAQNCGASRYSRDIDGYEWVY